MKWKKIVCKIVVTLFFAMIYFVSCQIQNIRGGKKVERRRRRRRRVVLPARLLKRKVSEYAK